MGNWTITVPEAATNLIVNPSFENDAIGAAAAVSWYKNIGTETFLIDTAYARFGSKSLKVVTAATTGSGIGMDVTAVTSASTQYTFTIYAIGTGIVKSLLYDAAGGFQYSSIITLSSTSFTKISVTKTFGAGASRFVGLISNQATAYTFWVDGAQLEAGDHATTYIDGDQPGGTWSGLRHLSASSRAANYRLGGREYDIQTQYGLRVRQFSGAGVADYELMTQELALQPGAVFLRDKISARTLTLTLDNNSTSAAGLHSKRKAFWNVIKPDALGQSQPFLIGYSGAASGKTVYGAFRYAGGWGLNDGINGGANYIEAGGTVGLRLLAVDPFWYADDAESAVLDYQDTVAADFGFARINGAWQKLGTGFNDDVLAMAIDYNSGRVYFGGLFTTANGVTVNGIAYWDGVTFQPLGSATKGVAGGAVNSIAIAPNGDVWAGGAFTTAGGSATKGLAKWAAVGTSAPSVFNTATTFSEIKTVAIDKDYRVYIGGTFTVYGGTANASYICYSANQGTSWVAITATAASGGTPLVSCIVVDVNGTSIYFGGNFTAIGGVANTAYIAKYDRTSITSLGSVLTAAVNSMAVASNGILYVSGDIEKFLSWNGSSFTNLSSGLSSTFYNMSFSPKSNLLYAGGLVTLKAFNGSKFIDFDASFSTPLYNSVVADRNSSNVYTGFAVDAATAVTSGRTTVTVLSTAPVYPIITITGPTTAASTCTLQWLENQTTGERLYFNLAINTGEIITIDLRPQSRKVTSNWRGQILDQPLPTSDYSSWHLVTGANTVAAFMTGTITGATMTMNWAKIHASIDGEAA